MNFVKRLFLLCLSIAHFSLLVGHFFSFHVWDFLLFKVLGLLACLLVQPTHFFFSFNIILYFVIFTEIVTLICLFVFIYNLYFFQFFFPVEGIGYNFDYILATFRKRNVCKFTRNYHLNRVKLMRCYTFAPPFLF